jgi:ATP-dependent 26S proteasome regulatory subunit
MFAIRKERAMITHQDFLWAIEKVTTDFNRNHIADVEGAMFA